jgi:hypothetical protein
MPHLQQVTFRLEFVRYSATRERVFTREHLERMDRWVANQVARIRSAVQSNEWPATVNAGCSFCKLDCPLVMDGLSQESVGQIRSAEHARSMAHQAYAMARQSKALLATLKAYTAEAGPLDIGNDIELGFSKREKWEYQPKTIMQLNAEHGFDPLRALHVSAKDVKKVGKNYPEYVERARATARDRSNTVFQFKNQIGDPLEIDDTEEEFD